MGLYYEPRPPSGAPADGERDVWLEGGKVKFGHYVAATSLWTVDKEIDYNGITGADTLDGYHAIAFSASDHNHSGVYSATSHNHSGTYEPTFSKNTAFNKSFAGTGSATTPSRSDHTHGGTFEGDADTIDGQHASELNDTDDPWHYVGEVGEIPFELNASNLANYSPVRYRRINWICYIEGDAHYNQGGIGILFILPEGYRPTGETLTFFSNTSGEVVYVYTDGKVCGGAGAHFKSCCFPTL